MTDPRFVERVWYGRDGAAAAMRLALSPFEAAFGAAVAVRGLLYDSGLLRARTAPVPAVAVGNLTVGGTGKTPISAWLAGRLTERGMHPAIVLRGYGDDEPAVHRLLNPGIPVIAAADRVAGMRLARAQGADVAVLDDAFQHRQAQRLADVVLVSADRWAGRPRLLPAGPWREPPSAARRATVLVVTRKAASDAQVAAVDLALERAAPDVPRACIALTPSEVVEVGGTQRVGADALAGRSVRALTAIGDPSAFVRQLEERGARVTAVAYADHHAFTDADITAFAADARGSDFALCTLKDAVKLEGRWPREAPPLWYVSQHVNVERGADALGSILERVVRARDTG